MTPLYTPLGYHFPTADLRAAMIVAMSDAWSAFTESLDLSLPEALAVVATTVVMYLLLTVVLRTWGHRLSAGRASSTVALAAVLGAVVGRTTLGPKPDLEGGVLVLATLLLSERVAVAVRRSEGRDRAVPLVVDGQVDEAELARQGLRLADLWSALRGQGVTSLDGVGLVVLEPSGSLSVLTRDRAVDTVALTGVRGADALPADLFGGGARG